MLTGLFIIALFVALYLGRVVLVPILLAAVLAVVLTPAVRFASRFKIPPPISAFLVLGACVAVLAVTVWFISAPAMAWAERLPAIARDLERKTEGLRAQVAEVEEISGQVGELVAGEPPPAPGAVEVVVRESPAVARLFVIQFGSVVIAAALVFTLAFFLLASGDSFLRKLINVIPQFRGKVQAVTIVRQIQHEIALYFSTITVINVGLGVVTGVAMALMGLPNAMLWGIMAGVLNFVPYLGAIVGTAIIGLVATTESETIGPVLAAMGVYYALTIIESNLVTPFLLGRRMTLNPVLIFVSLMVWGWMWGLAGVFLAIPILGVLKIIGDRIPSWSPVSQFLAK